MRTRTQALDGIAHWRRWERRDREAGDPVMADFDRWCRTCFVKEALELRRTEERRQSTLSTHLSEPAE
jgi:hypothetical protein